MNKAWVLAVAVAVGGCQDYDDRLASATEFVTQYLDAAAGNEELLGWTMLGSEIQAGYENDVNAYLRVVRAATWVGLEWEVDNITTDDDFVFVRLRATHGSFPEYLREIRGNMTIAPGTGALVQFSVRFGLFNSRTLRAFGG